MMRNRDIGTERDPRRIAAQLEHDRAALRLTMASLRQRIMPDPAMRDGVGLLRQSAMAAAKVAGRTASANPLATALIGAGLVWLSWGGRKAARGAAAADLPAWLAAAEDLQDRANAMLADIDAAAGRAGLALDEIEEARADVRGALARDLERALSRGLDDLDPEERQAALAVREARLSRHLGLPEARKPGLFTANSALGGAAIAGAAAALAAYLKPRSAAPSAADLRNEALLRDLQDNLERTRRQLAEAAARLAERDGV